MPEFNPGQAPWARTRARFCAPASLSRGAAGVPVAAINISNASVRWPTAFQPERAAGAQTLSSNGPVDSQGTSWPGGAYTIVVGGLDVSQNPPTPGGQSCQLRRIIRFSAAAAVERRQQSGGSQGLGLARRIAVNRAVRKGETAGVNALWQRFDSTSGASIDTELSNLVALQNAPGGQCPGDVDDSIDVHRVANRCVMTVTGAGSIVSSAPALPNLQ